MRMLRKSTYLKLVRASAWYDVIVTGAFATPWSFVLIITQLNGLHIALGLPGETVSISPYSVLFANFFGSVVLLWSVLRIRHASVRLGRYDAAGRALFSLWQINALLSGASLLLLPVLAIEAGLGVAQSLPVRDSA
jgi:hypothetical protein